MMITVSVIIVSGKNKNSHIFKVRGNQVSRVHRWLSRICTQISHKKIHWTVHKNASSGLRAGQYSSYIIDFYCCVCSALGCF